MVPSVPVDWRTVDVVLSIAIVAVTPDFEDSRAMVSATDVEDEGSVIWGVDQFADLVIELMMS